MIVFMIIFLPGIVLADANTNSNFTPSGIKLPTPAETGLSRGNGINPIVGVVDNVAKFVTGLIGVLAILMIVISGIMYMTSGGDDDRIKVAKKMLTYSIVGLVVALFAFVIVVSVGKAFGI